MCSVPSAHIVTLTWNPALDVTTAVEQLEPWRKLRCDPATIEAGGGGINVARAVRALGGTAVAVAALGVSARPSSRTTSLVPVSSSAPSRSARGPVRTGRSPTVAPAPNIGSSNQARS